MLKLPNGHPLVRAGRALPAEPAPPAEPRPSGPWDNGRGAAKWGELHCRALAAPEGAEGRPWLEKFLASLAACGGCQGDARRYVRENPPEWGAGLFAWSVAFHNHVNRKLGKPELSEAEARRRWRKLAGEKILLRCNLCPGDILMLTAAVRDLRTAHGGRFEIGVDTHHAELWRNNPHVVPMRAGGEGVQVIDCQYPLIHRSNQAPYHFIHGFAQDLEAKLGVTIRLAEFKGDVHLSDEEKSLCPVAGFDVRQPYWVIAAGAAGTVKGDYTAKMWRPDFAQAVVDHFRSRVTFVRIGTAGDHHAPLDGVVDLIGKTSLRETLRLVYHAAGVLTGVSFPMHAAAAVPTRPGRPARRACVVVAGGREPAHWEAYPGHAFLSTEGRLPCCASGGCWKNKAWHPPGDTDANACTNPVILPLTLKGTPLAVGKCMDLIRPEDVIRAIEGYYDGGSLRYDEPPAKGPGCERFGPGGPRVAVEYAAAVARPPEMTPRQGGGPRIGLVIGTHGSIAHVHLQLEALRRRETSAYPAPGRPRRRTTGSRRR